MLILKDLFYKNKRYVKDTFRKRELNPCQNDYWEAGSPGFLIKCSYLMNLLKNFIMVTVNNFDILLHKLNLSLISRTIQFSFCFLICFNLHLGSI